MQLTKRMKNLLWILLAETRRLESVPEALPPGMAAALRREQREFQQFGVRHDLARWLGRVPAPADSAVCSRTLRHLEWMGLLLRINRWGGRRATHVCLTSLGRTAAERVCQEQQVALAELLADMDCRLDDVRPAGEFPRSGGEATGFPGDLEVEG